MAKTQMNVRIDETDKREGDIVFADLGYTPTEVVGLVWRFAAQNRANRRRVRDMLATCEAESNPEEAARRERLRAAIKRKHELDRKWQRMLEDMGLTEWTPLPETTNEEIHEIAALERMEQKGWT